MARLVAVVEVAADADRSRRIAISGAERSHGDLVDPAVRVPAEVLDGHLVALRPWQLWHPSRMPVRAEPRSTPGRAAIAFRGWKDGWPGATSSAARSARAAWRRSSAASTCDCTGRWPSSCCPRHASTPRRRPGSAARGADGRRLQPSACGHDVRRRAGRRLALPRHGARRRADAGAAPGRPGRARLCRGDGHHGDAARRARRRPRGGFRAPRRQAGERPARPGRQRQAHRLRHRATVRPGRPGHDGSRVLRRDGSVPITGATGWRTRGTGERPVLDGCRALRDARRATPVRR